MPWFMTRIKRGDFQVINPYNQKRTRIAARPDQVHTIVFWSKNFGPFLNEGYAEELVRMGYRLFFNFTINAPHAVLEPGVPALSERLDQLTRLVARFGATCIQWRFDPICYFKNRAGVMENNLARFPEIAEKVAALGIKVCITSFVDIYAKVDKRSATAGITFVDPPTSQKIERIEAMAGVLKKRDMVLMLCCEKELMAKLPARLSVRSAACIPNDRLAALYGPDISLRRDGGQRTAAGCGCRTAKDVGDYPRHPCGHKCLFCYANPGPVPSDPRIDE